MRILLRTLMARLGPGSTPEFDVRFPAPPRRPFIFTHLRARVHASPGEDSRPHGHTPGANITIDSRAGEAVTLNTFLPAFHIGSFP